VETVLPSGMEHDCVVHILKKGNNHTLCSSNGNVGLLVHVGKLFEEILHTRVLKEEKKTSGLP
jgi:hypothetical protein